MWNLLKLMQKNLVLSIPVFMLLGIGYGALFPTGFLKGWIVPITFLMVYPMMVTLNMTELFSRGGTRVQLAAMGLNFILTPLLGLMIGKWFFPDAPLLALGLLLTALLPTSGMTISWTGFAGGNMSAAVKMTVLGLIIGSLATPFYLKLFMGATVSVSVAGVFSQILFIVFLPLAAGYATQQLLRRLLGQERYEREWKPKFPLASTLGVLGIVFVSMALKAKSILSNPVVLLYYLLPLVLLYLLNFTVSTLVGKFLFGRRDGIALVYGTVMRNLSIALAVAMGAFGEQGSEIALIIALAYVVQVQAGAWYVRFTDRLFGTAESPDPTAHATPGAGGEPIAESGTGVATSVMEA